MICVEGKRARAPRSRTKKIDLDVMLSPVDQCVWSQSKVNDTALDPASFTGYHSLIPVWQHATICSLKKFPAVFVFELCGPARFINCGGYALK
jgi:hypothetical protein